MLVPPNAVHCLHFSIQLQLGTRWSVVGRAHPRASSRDVFAAPVFIMERRYAGIGWHGKEDIRCETVPDPQIVDPRDAIIKVTSWPSAARTFILWAASYRGMKSGDVLGHETMGEVVEVGKANKKLKIGDRVVVPFTISCGECRMCQWGFWSCCERSNPAAKEEAKQIGYAIDPLAVHLLGLQGQPELLAHQPRTRRRASPQQLVTKISE